MRKLAAMTASLLMAVLSTSASANVAPMPWPGPRPIRPFVRHLPLTMQSDRITVKIDGSVATTESDQVFYNPNHREVETSFVFPLPAGAVVDKFSLYIDGKEVQGEVLDKDKARQIFERIVRSMKDPALLEFMGKRLYKTSVYPVPPRGTRRVRMRYGEVISGEGGLMRFAYPLGTQKYSGQPVGQTSLDVTIRSKLPIKSVFSPSHPKGVEVVRKSDNEVRVTYEAKNAIIEKDFILYYSLNAKKIDCSVACHRPSRGKGVFLALVSPSCKVDKVIPKDIVFVVDTSGSMRGPKMRQAKAALKFCIRGLKADDRFGLIHFSTEARLFTREMQKAGKEAVEAALEHIDEIEARGGTNIHEGLDEALRMCPGDEARPSMIVFMTDGEPTVGVTAVPEILKKVKAANRKNARVFVFGVGTNIDTHLLDKLAEMNRGAREYVLPAENIEIKVSNFFTKVSSPVLSNVKIDFGGLDVYDMVPARMPDIFCGSQTEILGRYKGGGARAITITGRAGGEEKKIVFEAKFPEEISENDLLPRLWAVRQVGKLMDQIRLNGEKKELRDEVVALAREYGIMTPYTSMLVLEDEARRAPRRRVFGGRVMEEAKAGAPAAAEGLRGRSGGGAVDASRSLNAMQKGQMDDGELAGGLGREGRKHMKHVGSKTFYLKDGQWRDSAYDGETGTSKVKYMSDEYFGLLAKHPKLGKFLALGERVLVVFEGKAYEITE